MPELRIERAADAAAFRDWRHVHNAVIPPAALSPAEVRERAGRQLLDVAYVGDTLVGCMTVRPPTPGNGSTATVIARILPTHRRRGLGTTLYAHGLAQARALAPTAVETVVLASNPAGLRFALSHGFTQTDRYLLPGDTTPYIDLRLT
ncbi:GNAT family N-acetyltransferase [Streptomyces sp. NPDC046161]|uniref:GNAT family N-acetyltransferase n=1 Tax=Streptomyces sp. NPDC046161 TaxID=3155132 RepID=UPI0033FC4E23